MKAWGNVRVIIIHYASTCDERMLFSLYICCVVTSIVASDIFDLRMH